MKKRMIIASAVLLVSTIAVTAFAASETGNLTVTTTIAASCQAPSPSGNLVLPFSNSLGLTSQANSDQVTVSVTCSGSPTISSVAFGDGLYAASGKANTAADKYRAMLRNGASDNGTSTNYLGYRLFASKSTGFTPAATAGNNMMTAADSTASNYTLTLGDTGTSTFYVKGSVYDNRGSWSSSSAVTGGTYNDTVVMTISY